MNKVITRAKELIGLYGAVTAICEAAYAITEADDDERDCSTPFHLEFCENNADYVVEKLISIARNGAIIRPSIKEKTDTIIGSLQVLKQEYDRLKDAEFEDEILNDFPTILDEFFKELAKTIGHYPNYMKFNPFSADGWMDLYWSYFDSFADSVIRYIVYETGDFDCLLHKEFIEALKIAISS